jgi:hypothetical protein
MEDFREEIMTELEKEPARTLMEAAAVIEEVSGQKRSLPQVMKLKKNGFRPLRVGFLPAKADREKQKAFVEEKLKPLIKQAQEGFIEKEVRLSQNFSFWESNLKFRSFARLKA